MSQLNSAANTQTSWSHLHGDLYIPDPLQSMYSKQYYREL